MSALHHVLKLLGMNMILVCLIDATHWNLASWNELHFIIKRLPNKLLIFILPQDVY